MLKHNRGLFLTQRTNQGECFRLVGPSFLPSIGWVIPWGLPAANQWKEIKNIEESLRLLAIAQKIPTTRPSPAERGRGNKVYPGAQKQRGAGQLCSASLCHSVPQFPPMPVLRGESSWWQVERTQLDQCLEFKSRPNCSSNMRQDVWYISRQLAGTPEAEDGREKEAENALPTTRARGLGPVFKSYTENSAEITR